MYLFNIVYVSDDFGFATAESRGKTQMRSHWSANMRAPKNTGKHSTRLQNNATHDPEPCFDERSDFTGMPFPKTGIPKISALCSSMRTGNMRISVRISRGESDRCTNGSTWPIRYKAFVGPGNGRSSRRNVCIWLATGRRDGPGEGMK